VFVSSTFLDMHAERDHLVRIVFPRLRESLLRHRIHVIDVDLRWGVASEQDALEVRRSIIDECQPHFLCMLGGRFGCVSPGAAADFANDWWTTRRVAKVVRDRFGVSYHFNHVGKLLKAVRFSCQKPRRRASQRDEEAIDAWRLREWVRIKNGLVAAARRSCFSTKPASCCAR
jgi:hypothetical protein